MTWVYGVYLGTVAGLVLGLMRISTAGLVTALIVLCAGVGVGKLVGVYP